MDHASEHGQQQSSGGSRYVELTVVSAMHAFNARVCPACNGAKASGSPFCATDYLALPLHMRGFAVLGPDDIHFVEYYRRALQHLRDFPTRRVQFLQRGGVWPHATFDDLDRAGYRFLEHSRCDACRARVTFYRAPDGRKIAVNFDKCIPHADTCADPGWFARMKAVRREVRTSAKRKRRA